MTKESLTAKLKEYGQEHLVKFWNDLNDAEKESLTNDIDQIDFEEITNYYKKVKSSVKEVAQELDSVMNPVPTNLKGSFADSTPEQLNNYEMEGLKAISEGKVACLLMAGGQGNLTINQSFIYLTHSVFIGTTDKKDLAFSFKIGPNLTPSKRSMIQNTLA